MYSTEMYRAGEASTNHLLLIGNTGVGKSFVGNGLVGSNVFASAFGTLSVTSAVQGADVSWSVRYSLLRGAEWRVLDMPGLMEAGQQNAGRNAAEMTKALHSVKDVPALVAFVMTAEGGRLQSDQVETILGVQNSVSTRLTADNTIIIVNKMPDDGCDLELITAVQKVIPFAGRANVAVVPYFSGPERRDPSSAKVVEELVRPICALMVRATPCKYVVSQPVMVNPLANVLHSLTADMRETREQMEWAARANAAQLQAQQEQAEERSRQLAEEKRLLEAQRLEDERRQREERERRQQEIDEARRNEERQMNARRQQQMLEARRHQEMQMMMMMMGAQRRPQAYVDPFSGAIRIVGGGGFGGGAYMGGGHHFDDGLFFF